MLQSTNLQQDLKAVFWMIFFCRMVSHTGSVVIFQQQQKKNLLKSMSFAENNL